MKDLSLAESYSYKLEEKFIAQRRSKGPDDTKLLVRETNAELKTLAFSQLLEAIEEDSLLILNDTKVRPARLFGKIYNTDRACEILLLRKLGPSWECIGSPVKKLRKNPKIIFPDKLEAECRFSQSSKERTFEIIFNKDPETSGWLDKNAAMPLPPYIKRGLGPEPSDFKNYQTCYAKETGSAAAPTAGLHFTPEILKELKIKKNIEFAYLTLHVGLGTFLPVSEKDIRKHHMHEEYYFLPYLTYKKILEKKSSQKKIYAVGTTVLRALESFKEKQTRDAFVSTSLYIRPDIQNKTPYKTWCLDGIITNFHQPRSSLYILICALLGYEETTKVYDYALRKKYRFLSYGDTSLLKW